MKKFISSALILLLVACSGLAGKSLPKLDLTPEWSAKIEKIAPKKPRVEVDSKHKVLLFDLMTGYKHWVTPFTSEVIKILGDKTGAYEVTQTTDVSFFEPAKIKEFDIIVLNNTCSKRDHRDMFMDVLNDNEKAAALEKSLIEHIHRGNGLVVLHGGIVMQNKSAEFGEMLGGSFDFHPAQQEVIGNIVNPDHPLTKAFKGKPLVQIDEAYIFNNAYEKKNFRPLLEMDTSKIDAGKRTEYVRSDKRYIAWIKRYGQGRVFYCSPSHNAQVYDHPEFLQFILDGMQYAAGDLQCDDTPIGTKQR